MAGALAASILVIDGAAPQVAKVSAAAAVNDNWADATDVSTLAVPPFDGSFTAVQVAGTTVDSTIEAGEPPVIDGFGNPWPMGTVWYRYESPPGGFSGLLGYRMSDSSFVVNAYAAYEPDPFNPFLGLYPDEGPGALDRMAAAPAYVVRRDLPGGLSTRLPSYASSPDRSCGSGSYPTRRSRARPPGSSRSSSTTSTT
jgi:hypothetical protein